MPVLVSPGYGAIIDIKLSSISLSSVFFRPLQMFHRVVKCVERVLKKVQL